MNLETRVEEVMSRPVRKLSMNARVREAADFLRRWGITGAPVVDPRGKILGVFSFRDLAGHVVDRFEDLPVIDATAKRSRRTRPAIPVEEEFPSEKIDDTRVSELMTPAIVCVDPAAPVPEAARMMRLQSIHRLFVRRGRGPILGVLTTMDVMRWVTESCFADRKRATRKRVV